MPDTPFLSGLNFWVTDNPADGGGAPAAPTPTGGFAMSRDEMEAMLTRARNTIHLIEDQLNAARNFDQTVPPAQDQASVKFTKAANDSGRYYIGHLNVQHQHYNNLIEKLSRALGITVETDQQAGKDLPKTDVGEIG